MVNERRLKKSAQFITEFLYHTTLLDFGIQFK